MRAVFVAVAALFLVGPSLAQSVPARWSAEWPDTDFSMASVPFEEILSGGPPKDGIPAIDTPRFGPVAGASLGEDEPVVSLTLDGTAKAYPLSILTWHEIVNDEIAGVPVTLTYCPLCNSAIAFDRRLNGQVLDFGVSGKLRHSDMVMYDRQTESWWQQFTGAGIVGAMTGERLTMVPVRLEAWRLFRERHPDGLVLQQPGRGHRDYGRNPYVGYDTSARSFLYRGEDPPHGIPPMVRVVRVDDRAWLMDRIVTAGSLTEDGLTLGWSAGQNSALDTARIDTGRDVGNIVVTDAATGALVPHEVTFAFAFHAFHPQGRWMLSP